MQESFIGLPPDSTGKQSDTFVVTASFGPVHRQAIVLGDPNINTSVMAVKAGGVLPASASDGAGVVTVRDPVTVANPVTAPPVGTQAFNAGVVGVAGISGAATEILLPRVGVPGVGRVGVLVTNQGASTVTIGNADNMTSGYPLVSGAPPLWMPTQAAVWGYVASGSVNVAFIEHF
jgi:hypothetical protein